MTIRERLVGAFQTPVSDLFHRRHAENLAHALRKKRWRHSSGTR
jgi:hypothetical protein